MPPFGARGTASPPVPPADLRRHRRDLWCRVVFVATVTIIGAGAGLFMRSAEQVLDRRGVETEAVVVETNRVRRLPDEAVVQYRVEGLLRQATLTVSSAGDFEIGQRIAIVYDPDDPVHARPLEGWSPTYRTLWRYAAIAGPFALILSLTVPRRLRADTAAAGSGAVHHMYGASSGSSSTSGPRTSSACGPKAPTAMHRRHCRSRWTGASDHRVPVWSWWSVGPNRATTWCSASRARRCGPRAR
ncbi:MAG: hypothetical protein H0V52_04520 [Acidimicrobiia bacterium]|nr:hypothetical protein [Acidimicrobiia bacterium]